PALEHAVRLEPEVVVQPRGVVLLDDKKGLLVRQGPRRGRLGRLPKVPLRPVLGQGAGAGFFVFGMVPSASVSSPLVSRGRSRRQSRGSLSARSPSNRGCRSRPFCVHSAKAISATSSGRTQ